MKRILRALQLDKIAAVDRPAQEGARATIIKRAPVIPGAGVSKILKGLRANLAKSGLLADPDGDTGAKDFDAVIDAQEMTQELWDGFYKATDALRESVCSIINDVAVTDKRAMIDESLKQFADHLESLIPNEIGKKLAETVTAAIAGAAGPTLNKGVSEPMSEALKKALGLPATATEAEMVAALNKRDGDLKKAEQIAKMSDKHKGYMDHKDAKMPEGGKDAFGAMSASEREAHMEKHPLPDENEDVEKSIRKGDAFRTADGQIVTKRAVGEATFGILKSQDARLKDQAAEIAKAKDREETATFAKRATDLGFPAEYGATLRKVYAGDAEAIAKHEVDIKALRTQVATGALFSEIGKGAGVGGQPGSADAQIWAKANDLRKTDPKLTEAQAFAKAYADPANREIVALHKRERAAAAH